MTSEPQRERRVDIFDGITGDFWRVPIESVLHMPNTATVPHQLCREFHKHGTCPRGESCQFAHVPARIISETKRDGVHMDTTMLGRLPADWSHAPGTQVRVSRAEDASLSDIFDSSQVLITRGSLLMMAAVKDASRDTRKKGTSQQCTHFHNHHVCHRGPRCYFIHVVSAASVVAPAAIAADTSFEEHTPSFCSISESLGEPSDNARSRFSTPETKNVDVPIISPHEVDRSPHDAALAATKSPCCISAGLFHHNPYSVVASKVFLNA